METLKRCRRPLRTQLTKLMNDIDQELSQQIPDPTTLKVKIEMLDKLFQKVDDIDKEILVSMAEQEDYTEQQQDDEILIISEYEEKYRTVKMKCEKCLVPITHRSPRSSSPSGSTSTVGPTSNVDNKRVYKLPKIEIKKFNGDMKEWLGFWAQFEKIHEDNSLHVTDKFQYLVQSMVPGTRAHKLVTSYPQSAANYPKVIEALNDRFGDKVLLTELYVRQLLKLTLKNVGKPKEVTLDSMYDELESNLRSLETLGVTQDQSAAFLYPLVESSLPEEIVKVWQRSTASGYEEDDKDKRADERLTSLMKFLRKEIRGAERLSYVRDGLVHTARENEKRTGKGEFPDVPTAAALFSTVRVTCVFCEKAHDSQLCINAQSMTLEMKKEKLARKGVCFSCLKQGHVAKDCPNYVKCLVCGRKHVGLMCPELTMNKTDMRPKETKNKEMKEQVSQVHSHLNCTRDIMLQTLLCTIFVGERSKQVRILFDSGSQRSYILEETMKELGDRLVATDEVSLCHILFGGRRETKRHSCYHIEIGCKSGKFRQEIELLGQDYLCGKLPRMSRGPWLKELKEKKIFVSDVGEECPKVEILIGADYYAKLLTGRTQCLSNGLTAVETKLGWTLSGECKSPENVYTNLAIEVNSLFVSEASVTELWNLESIGIREPADYMNEKIKHSTALQHFVQSVQRAEESRYSVCLPWTAGKEELPKNRELAEKRLLTTTKKLQEIGYLKDYGKVFDEWLAEGFIEVVNVEHDQTINDYYLPHRAVVKPNSLTTPIRPVFDASCKSGRYPSLNECLEKGPNFLEIIPNVLLRFREQNIGVTSDIRKAFQMIEINESDRDCLRFLWWLNSDPEQKELIVYRHRRVVFGLNCSPFLLNAVIELHIRNVGPERAWFGKKLLQSFYVDNCVTSVSSVDEYEAFKTVATEIMAEAGMELRQWERSLNAVDSMQNEELCKDTTVLGLIWNKREDSLSCHVPDFDFKEIVTKRSILSYLSKFFDPIGFTCPTLLQPKLILQQTCIASSGWDEVLSMDIEKRFKNWVSETHHLRNMTIPRNLLHKLPAQADTFQLHVFCDASQEAYATVIYLRTVSANGLVCVQLAAAKSRLAPLRRPTIPRLELLACTIGARLATTVKAGLTQQEVDMFFWTDSMTALSWIKRNDEWGTFVGNRVKEICALSNPTTWRHVPGIDNPADLPSRGCTPAVLKESRWWEGPQWLHKHVDHWPVSDETICEAEVMAELKGKRKSETVSVVQSLLLNSNESEQPIYWYMPLSNYEKNVRVVAWLRRFVNNTRRSSKTQGLLTVEELQLAEVVIFKSLQQEVFPGEHMIIHNLRVERGSDDLYRIRTKITNKPGFENFSLPILLPSNHPLVCQLIHHYHLDHHHAGVQILISKMRERFWVLKSRKTITKIVRQCTRCRRFSSKPFQTDPTTLPDNRTNISEVFQVIGVDLAGPVYMKGDNKCWIVIFTCAVYRCIHLDFVTSMDTEAFLNSLERFISLRGRPSIAYSDNGTNFIGCVNLFVRVDWKKVEEHAHVRRIKWIFNPPTAAWWGGWWERLIRIVKDLMKRMLGFAKLNYDQFRTCLAHVENVVNDRPLTAVTEDQDDLVPLTPSMFMRGIRKADFPEGDFFKDLGTEYRRRKTIQSELQDRFRKEYLAMLVQRSNQIGTRAPKVGEIVLVGSDDKKRLQWPLAKVIELIPGRDNKVRVVRVKTANGILLRPVQRLYSLEVNSDDTNNIYIPGISKNSAHTDSYTPVVATSQDPVTIDLPIHKNVSHEGSSISNGSPVSQVSRYGRMIRPNIKFKDCEL